MNIAIIGQNPIFRDSLLTLLSQVVDFNIKFDCGDIHDFFNNPDASMIDLILIDGVIGSLRYSEITSRIKEFSDGIKVLFLSEATDHYYWEDQHKYNVEGTLLKNSKKKEFEEKIRSLV